MESFPKLYSAMVVRIYVKASSECVFQVWKKSQQLYWGSLTLWKYMETWERSYIAKMSNVTLKAGLWRCYIGGFCLSLNISSCINSTDENCKCRSKRTVFHKGIFWFASREHSEDKLFAGIWKKCVQTFTSFTALIGRDLVSLLV